MASTLQNPPGLAAMISGERIRLSYLLSGGEAEARALAEDICLEQSVEFPRDLLPEGEIPGAIVGRIESFEPASGDAAGDAAGAAEGRWAAEISFSVESCGVGAKPGSADLVQLLNVIFGNISIKPGILVTGISLPDSFLAGFRGPRFGREGLRGLVGVERRPLICSALKPMGLSARELADQAYRFALGGLDMIKDDHGLANQPFSPFDERLEACAEAVARANRETGHNCLYLPNVSGPADLVLERARRARKAGAGGILVCPSLVGFDAMRLIADDDSVGLPVMAHPAFGGSLVTCPANGIAHGLLYGTLMRLAGADASVYPNYGGRFSFSREECAGIARATAAPLGGLKPLFPAPGGGMTTDRAADMLDVYGRDFVMLIGGGLHRRGPDLSGNVRYFVDVLEAM